MSERTNGGAPDRAPEPRAGRIRNDGLEIAWLDWGGDGEPLVLLHPNGFCAGMYHPLARRLVDSHLVLAVDLRGHGASEVVTDPALLGNDAMARDVLAVLDRLGIDGFDLLGVSLGGGVGIVVAADAGDRVGTLVIAEAIAASPEAREDRYFDFVDGEHPLAVGARRRRRVWADRAAVAASYGARPPLDVLDPEVLAAYVRWGFVERADGQVELACDPETEAGIFGTTRPNGPIHSFTRLADLRCRSAVLHGVDTDLPAAWFAEQAEILGVELQIVDGGHFFLFEDLDRAEALIRRALA